MVRGRKGHPADASLRFTIAQTAAKIMAEEHVVDFRRAKEKALDRLGISGRCELPANQEIESALIEYRRLFMDGDHSQSLLDLYQTALHALELFAVFRPRLVGSLLSGVADLHTPIEFHLFSDHPEAVVTHLLDLGMPYRERHRRYRWPEGVEELPAVSFIAGEIEIIAAIFPEDGIRRAPLSPVDGRPMRRAEKRVLEHMIEDYEPRGSSPHGS